MASEKTKKIVEDVMAELERAESKFGPYNSSHEGYAVILEELDELWDVVKLNPKKIPYDDTQNNFLLGNIPQFEDNEESINEYVAKSAAIVKSWQNKSRNAMMRAEAIQVACTAIRFIKDVCDDE